MVECARNNLKYDWKYIMADGYFMMRADIEPIEMFEGVKRRTLGTTDEAMLCEFHLKRGSVVPQHSHMNDQVGYVIHGKLRLTVGDTTEVLSTGDSYAIPGGVIHGAVAVEDCVLIDSFSPPRNDYRTEAR
jgi:quercetin dioxygenase-like cupin family protein